MMDVRKTRMALFECKVEHDHFALSSDPHRRSPQRKSGRDIDLCLPVLTIAVRQFEYQFLNQIEWPNLTIVRMAAELQIDAELTAFLQFIRLVIEQEDRSGSFGSFHQCFQRKTVEIGTIVIESNRIGWI